MQQIINKILQEIEEIKAILRRDLSRHERMKTEENLEEALERLSKFENLGRVVGYG